MEGERRVYYDLDADARGRHIFQPSTQLDESIIGESQSSEHSYSTTVVRERPREQAAFSLEVESRDVQVNPFASLLRPMTPPPQEDQVVPQPDSLENASQSLGGEITPRAAESLGWSQSPIAQMPDETPLNEPPRRESSIHQPEPLECKVERADARPARWSRPTTSFRAKRQAETSLQRQKRARQASTKRHAAGTRPRSILPTETSSQPKIRLSDRLNQAIRNSQNNNIDMSPHPAVDRSDRIEDTPQVMRSEALNTSFSSPLPSNGLQRRSVGPSRPRVVPGKIGRLLEKATHKIQQDRTLLHSNGQSLWQRQSQTTDLIQQRQHVVLWLDSKARSMQAGQGQVIYDAYVESIEPQDESGLLHTRIVAVFSSDVFNSLDLGPNKYVKVYAPYHLIDRWRPAGDIRCTSERLLVSTDLSESVDSQ